MEMTATTTDRITPHTLQHVTSPATKLLAAALLVCSALQPIPLSAATNGDDATPQQTLFWEAKRALERGDEARFGRYSARLKDYPLYPYLLYWHLKQRLPHALPLSIEAFLKRYDDQPVATLLRASWLYQLARQKRWEDYLGFYQPTDDAALRCFYHYAQYQTGDRKAAWEGAKRLWLVDHSQDKACNPLFSAWQRAGGITPALRWQRVALLMDNDEIALADGVANRLGSDERRALQLWQKAYHNPALLRHRALHDDNPINRTVILHTLLYRAPRAPRGTAALWQALESHYRFSTQERTAIRRAIALGLSYDNAEQALTWFARLPVSEHDTEVCNQALRIALRYRHWGQALAWLTVLPGEENHSTRATYWRGRILEEMGFPDSAYYYFKAITEKRSYYGFLAADRLNRPYNLNSAPLQVKFPVLNRVANRPGIARALELYHLGLIASARREWEQAVVKMDHDEMLAASKLADAFGWEDRALLTLAKADHFEDLSIRFPLSFNKTVNREARRRALDPAWVYAVVRQESAMMPNVRSPVGALGLMQLMPQTGSAIARQLQLAQPDHRQLLKPETNIRFGSYYLRQVLQEFNHNPVLATAAYNAGPDRIRRWYPRHGTMDADIWVDTIPFDETREYVRRVMAYAVFYDQRLQRPVKRLYERMPTIGKQRTQLTACPQCRQQPAVLAQATSGTLH